MDSDAELTAIRNCKAGHIEAFAPIVDAYRARLHALAWRILHDRHEAEEATQDAFVRAFAALNRFDESQPLSHWLLRITTNLCLNRLRKRRDLPRDLTPDDTPLRASERDTTTPHDQAAHAELMEALDTELAALPETQRLVFGLFHQRHMAYTEISELLGRPVGTVKSDLHRARQQLISGLQRRGLGPFEAVANPARQ